MSQAHLPSELGPVEQWLSQMLAGFAVYEAVRDDAAVVDFRRVYVNPAGAKTMRPSVGEDTGGGPLLSAVRPGAWLGGVFDRLREVVEHGTVWEDRRFPYSDDTTDVVFDVRAWPAGQDHVAVTWQDVTAEVRAVEALAASEDRFRATVDQLPDAVSVFESVRDEDGTICDFRWVYANEHNARMTGYTVNDLVGHRLLEVFPEQREAGMVDVYTRVVESGQPYEQATVWYEDTWGDGTRRRRAFDVRASRVGDGFVVVSRDVTELRTTTEDLRASEAELLRANAEVVELNASLRDLVMRDPLTRLHNRRYLDQRLENLLKNPGELGLLQIDLDYFKAINDRLGHGTGDAVLRAVADVLRSTFRGEDVVCRYGGEEFTVILPDCDLDAAVDRAQQLRRNLKHQRRVLDGLDRLPTVSIGVAIREAGASADQLLRRADQALLRAKTQGRDRVCVGAVERR